MALVLKGKPQTVKATRKLAEKFATMTPCPHDRPVRGSIIRMLEQAAKDGTLRGMTWATAHCKETKESYRINGKHTSTYLFGSNGEVKEWPYVTIEEYDCDTMADVAELYSTYDPSRSSRSTGDINRVFSATNSEFSEIPPSTFNLCVSGIAYSHWGTQMFSHEPRERAQLATMFPAFVQMVADIVPSNTSERMLRRVGVIAAMFRTWQKSKTAAEQFWTAVRDGSGAKADDPDRQLQLWLIKARTMGTRFSSSASGGPVSTHEMISRCITAWNAWRKGARTSLRYHSGSDIPPAL